MFTLIYYTFKVFFFLMFLPLHLFIWMLKLIGGLFGWLFIGLGLLLDDGRY